MKRKILGGLAAAAMLAGGLAFTAGAAHAVQTEPSGDACYETESFVEYQFRKTVTTPAVDEVSHVEYRWDIETREPIIQEKIEKETRTRNWVKGEPGFWQNFSPNRDQGTFEGPPAWPNDPRGTWSKPKENGGPQQDASGVFQNGEGNGSWFYRDPGTEGSWGEWGDWSDWPGAGPVWDDGRDRGPAAHGSGNGWQRQYRYVVVDTRVTGYTAWTPAGSTEWSKDDTAPAGTDTTRYVNPQSKKVVTIEGEDAFDTTYYFTGGEPSTSIDDAVWTESDPGKPWEKFKERDRERQVEVDCPPTPPTTEPPVTTEPPTTVPESTQPPVTAPPAPTTPPPAPASGELPATGGPLTGLLLAIAGLLTLTGGAALVARRR